MTGCLTQDVDRALTVARFHSVMARTPGFLINYGLPPWIAQALVRGGWSRVIELDVAERTWSTTKRRGADGTFDAWLNVPNVGAVAVRDLRRALARWRDDAPVLPAPATGTGRLVATMCSQIAAGEFGHGDVLPAMASLAHANGVKISSVAKAYDVLALAGWCGWRYQPYVGDSRHRQRAVALLPGRPYDVTWSETTSMRARRRAADAADLLRHNPGAWRSQDTTHTLRMLAPIADVDFDDAAATLTISGAAVSAGRGPR